MGFGDFLKKIGINRKEKTPGQAFIKKDKSKGPTTIDTLEKHGDITKEEAEKVREAEERLKKPATPEEIMNMIIEQEEKHGRKFENYEMAKKWAIRKMERIAEKMRKMGTPVCCEKCGKSGCKGIGPLRKTKTGYAHNNCKRR